jgi:hypothetical protein
MAACGVETCEPPNPFLIVVDANNVPLAIFEPLVDERCAIRSETKLENWAIGCMHNRVERRLVRCPIGIVPHVYGALNSLKPSVGVDVDNAVG